MDEVVKSSPFQGENYEFESRRGYLQRNKMRILAIGDTHMLHKDLGELPRADVIVHVGDFLDTGKERELHEFSKWWMSLPYDHKIIIAGNHDRCLQWKPELAELLQDDNSHYLYEDNVVINGISFYGTPWSPTFKDWSFMLTRNSDELEAKWEDIPSGIDVLLTHCPPLGYRDRWLGQRVGCELLTIELMRKDKIQPKHHIFGHVHYDTGEARLDNIKLHNVSTQDTLLGRRKDPLTIIDIAM